jgi:hypothetical protein
MIKRVRICFSTKNLYPKMSLKQPLACKLISTVEQDDTLFLLSMNATSMHLCHFDVIWSIEFHYPDNKKANSNTFYHWIIFAFMSTVLSKGATELFFRKIWGFKGNSCYPYASQYFILGLVFQRWFDKNIHNSIETTLFIIDLFYKDLISLH